MYQMIEPCVCFDNIQTVLFFHLLRELFEEKIEDADELAEKILPSENYLEKLLNWKIINEGILEKLKINKSNWFLEYLAKGNVEYIECVRSILNASLLRNKVIIITAKLTLHFFYPDPQRSP